MELDARFQFHRAVITETYDCALTTLINPSSPLTTITSGSVHSNGIRINIRVRDYIVAVFDDRSLS